MNEPAHKRITHHHHWITNRTEKIAYWYSFRLPPLVPVLNMDGIKAHPRTRNVQGTREGPRRAAKKLLHVPILYIERDIYLLIDSTYYYRYESRYHDNFRGGETLRVSIRECDHCDHRLLGSRSESSFLSRKGNVRICSRGLVYTCIYIYISHSRMCPSRRVLA